MWLTEHNFFFLNTIFEKLHIGTLNRLTYLETMLKKLSALIVICNIFLFTNNDINLLKPTGW